MFPTSSSIILISSVFETFNLAYGDEDLPVRDDVRSDLFFPPPNYTSPLSDEQQLVEHLLEHCPFLAYSNARPVRDSRDPVESFAKLQMIKFTGIDDAHEVFYITSILIVRWALPPPCASWFNDPNWLHVWRIYPRDEFKMWYPVLWQPNSADDVFSVSHNFANPLEYVTQYIEGNGWAGYDAVGKYSAHCNLAENLTKFPFDKVTCSLHFQSWSPTILVSLSSQGFQAIRSDLSNGSDMYVPQSFISGSSAWSLDGYYFQETVITMGSHKYNRLEFCFFMKRKSASYVVNIFVPCFALFAMLLSAFGIPRKEPERPTFALTVVTNLFLLQTLIQENLPISSEPIYVSLYLTALLWLGVFCTGYFAMGNYLSRHRRVRHAKICIKGKICVNLLSALDALAFGCAVIGTALINGITLWKMSDD